MFHHLLVVLGLVHGVVGNVVDLEEACGSTLRSRCPTLTKFVVGGSPSCAQRAPWNVLLELKLVRRKRQLKQTSNIEVLCGGTLVTSRHVVSAAHCVWSNSGSRGTCREPFSSLSSEECKKRRCPRECWRVQPGDLNAYLGLTERVGNTRAPFRVKSIHIHPGWDRFTPLNNITAGSDLAVLELERPVVFSDSTWPICLPSLADSFLIAEGETLDIHGFGVRDLERREHAELLQTAKVKLVNPQICRSQWNTTGDQLCTVGAQAAKDGRVSDSCNGDSGGGVVAQRFDQSHVLVGVVSFGESDCGAARGRPSVNTNVLAHLSWIRNVTGTLQQCTTQDGRSCIFPFEFMGEVYAECTTTLDPEDKLWCSTLTDAFGRHVENAGEWGHCSQSCQIEEASGRGGVWGPWGDWTQCSRSCGPGKRIRLRECVSGQCEGNEITSKSCDTVPCKDSMIWTAWSSWSTCTGGCPGSRKRTRICQKATVAASVSLRFGVVDLGEPVQTCEGVDTELERCGPIICGETSPVLKPTSVPGSRQTAVITSNQTNVPQDKTTAAPPVSISKPSAAPPVSISKTTAAPPVSISKPTATPPVSISKPTAAPPVSISKPTAVPPVSISKTTPATPLKEANRNWGQWSEYSVCSTSCRDGVKKRSRECVGTRGGCFGSPTDIQQCGTIQCDAEKYSIIRGLELIREVLVLVGGWDGQWLPNVTIVDGGRVCAGPSLPVWLADHFAVLVKDRLVTCGGRSGEDKTLCWQWRLGAAAPRAWERAPTMLGGRSYADAVTVGSTIWVSGGWDGKVRHKTSEVLDLGQDGRVWRAGEDITSRRYQHCGAALSDGSIVLTGGQDGVGKSGVALSTVELYDVKQGFLAKLPNLQQARWTHGCTRFLVEGREAVLVAGGRVTSGAGDELDSVEVYVIGDSRWNFRTSLPQPRLGPGLVTVDNRVLVTGGSYEVGTRVEEFPDSILEYEPGSDSWRVVQRLVGRTHHAVISLSRSLLSC